MSPYKNHSVVPSPIQTLKMNLGYPASLCIVFRYEFVETFVIKGLDLLHSSFKPN